MIEDLPALIYAIDKNSDANDHYLGIIASYDPTTKMAPFVDYTRLRPHDFSYNGGFKAPFLFRLDNDVFVLVKRNENPSGFRESLTNYRRALLTMREVYEASIVDKDIDLDFRRLADRLRRKYTGINRDVNIGLQLLRSWDYLDNMQLVPKSLSIAEKLYNMTLR